MADALTNQQYMHELASRLESLIQGEPFTCDAEDTGRLRAIANLSPLVAVAMRDAAATMAISQLNRLPEYDPYAENVLIDKVEEGYGNACVNVTTAIRALPIPDAPALLAAAIRVPEVAALLAAVRDHKLGIPPAVAAALAAIGGTA